MDDLGVSLFSETSISSTFFFPRKKWCFWDSSIQVWRLNALSVWPWFLQYSFVILVGDRHLEESHKKPTKSKVSRIQHIQVFRVFSVKDEVMRFTYCSNGRWSNECGMSLNNWRMHYLSRWISHKEKWLQFHFFEKIPSKSNHSLFSLHLLRLDYWRVFDHVW